MLLGDGEKETDAVYWDLMTTILFCKRGISATNTKRDVQREIIHLIYTNQVTQFCPMAALYGQPPSRPVPPPNPSQGQLAGGDQAP